MDNFILAMLINEISEELEGSSVQKVTGLAPMSLVIELRRKGRDAASFLLICLDPSFPALVPFGTTLPLGSPFTGLDTETPATTLPEGFVQSMSQRLSGTILSSLAQHDADRVVGVEFCEEGGRQAERRSVKLWLELFGRRPCAVLVRTDENVIEACSREGTASSAGTILRAGEKYEPPSQVAKLGVNTVAINALRALLEKTLTEKTDLKAKHQGLALSLSRLLKGFSPHAASEIVRHVFSGGHLTPEALFQGLKEVIAQPERYFRPAVRLAAQERREPPALLPAYAGTQQGAGENGGKEASHAEIEKEAATVSREEETTAAQSRRQDTPHAMRVFSTSSEAARFSFSELCRWYRAISAGRIRRRTAFYSLKLAKLKSVLLEDLSSAERAHDFRIAGELILANINGIRRGSTFAELKDIHADGQSLIKVELDPSLSLSNNAERYFKKARKAERALALLRKRLASVERSLLAIEKFNDGVPEEIDANELKRLSRELDTLAGRLHVSILTGLGKGKSATLRAQRLPVAPKQGRRERAIRTATVPTAAKPRAGTRAETSAGARFNPRVFETSDGLTVLVGRDNKENDYVTHHLAGQEDLWFHASGMPGSHVILKKKGKSAPSRRAIEEAASVAAYFSKGRTSSSVPVIYTEKKYVHKARGSRPGAATCTRERFLMAAPRKPRSTPV